MKEKFFVVLVIIGFLMGCSNRTLPDNTTRVATAVSNPEPDDVLILTETAVFIQTPLATIGEESMTITATFTPTVPGAEQLIQLAKQNLAQLLAIDVDEIVLERMESVIWPDSSLGCPMPGMVYTQVRRDGYRIWLRVAKDLFAYHGGGVRGPFLCQSASSSDLLPPPGFGDE